MYTGQYGRHLAQIVAAAYQVKFGLKCMMTMEDDVELPEDFRDRLSHFPNEMSKPKVWRLGFWGEGVLFNLKGAREFINRIYHHGVFIESDNFIIRFMEDMDSQIDLGARLLVTPNGGSIVDSGHPGADKFNYTSSLTSGPMEKLMNTFVSENDLDMTNVLTRFTRG